jgi:hypothetical protein
MTGAATSEATERRTSTSFGGIVPCSESARDGSAQVAALAVEHHADGAAIPLLILSDTPGLLAWEPLDDATVRDDRDRPYSASILHGQAGLGALQASLWIDPAPPPDAKFLSVSVPMLLRLSPARSGNAIPRQLPGGPWDLIVNLVPPRTTAPIPPRPHTPPEEPGPGGRVPSRTLSAFRGLIPVGQARIARDMTVCLWAIERYDDLALLTLSMLGAQSGDIPGEGALLDVWDDRGTRYEASLEQAGSAESWSEVVVRIAPAIDLRARRLAVSVDVAHGDGDVMEFLFGIAITPLR